MEFHFRRYFRLWLKMKMLFGRPLVYITKRSYLGLGLEMQSLGLGLEHLAWSWSWSWSWKNFKVLILVLKLRSWSWKKSWLHHCLTYRPSNSLLFCNYYWILKCTAVVCILYVACSLEQQRDIIHGNSRPIKKCQILISEFCLSVRLYDQCYYFV